MLHLNSWIICLQLELICGEIIYPQLDFDISPYAVCHNNPVTKVDPNGRWVETAWDIFSLVTGAKSFVDNVSQGNVGAAIVDGVGVVADVAAVVLPGVPAGAGVGIKAIRAADEVGDVVKTTNKASTITENAKQGKQFEKAVTEHLNTTGHENIAEQITIKPNVPNSKNVRVDNVSKKNGKIQLTEAKSSKTAPLTKNQKTGYPAIEEYGGVVVGNKGANMGYPAGTIIPPINVLILRPEDLLK